MTNSLKFGTSGIRGLATDLVGEESRRYAAAFLRYLEDWRGAALLLVPTRANGQPAFGCYLPSAQADIARARSMAVLTLNGDRISAITWFTDTSVFPHFGLPRTLR